MENGAADAMLPPGQRIGRPSLPYALGHRLVEVSPRPIHGFIIENQPYHILEAARRDFYTRELRSFNEECLFYEGLESSTNFTFLNASPLITAIKYRHLAVVIALIAVDPSLVNLKTSVVCDKPLVRCTRSGERMLGRDVVTKELSPHEISSIFYNKLYWESQYHQEELSPFLKRSSKKITRILLHWESMSDLGTLLYNMTINARMHVLGSKSSTILCTILCLSLDDIGFVMRSLIEQDHYLLLLLLGNHFMSDIHTQASIFHKITSGFLPFFPTKRVGDPFITLNENFLHNALITGKMRAAAALAILQPCLICPLWTKPSRSNPQQPLAVTYTKITLSELVKTQENMPLSIQNMFVRILSLADSNTDALRVLGLPTLKERIEAAQEDPDAMLRVWNEDCDTHDTKRRKTEA